MAEQTEQSKFWSGEFGKEYTDRNPHSIKELDNLYKERYGITRTALNQNFLRNLNKDIKILEIGSNIGTQLLILQNLGFKNLAGVDISDYALEESKKLTKNISFMKASALDLPFKNNYFDLVFTSGVLIHIHPDDLPRAINEIYRVSKKYIWCFEYFSEKLEEIEYRKETNKLWKNNFMKLFLDRYPDLKIVKEKKLNYLENENIDHMFLLEK